MAWCSFPDPHHPLSPPEPWFSRHDPADIDLPSTFADEGADWPVHITMIRGLEPDPGGHGQYVTPFGPTAAQTQQAIAVTYGMIEAIDDGIGQIMATLESTGELDNTIIVFTSDHGDMMGDHGLMLKGGMHFQGCLRVPLVIRTPDGSPARTDSLAASIDLPHTVLDLCGVAEFHGMQGVSLTPTLKDPQAAVRAEVLIEDDFPIAEVLPLLPLKTRTLVTAQHRYTRDSSGHESLYDLVADPDELVNIAVDGRDPEALRSVVSSLVDAMMRADDLTRTGPVSP
jgi:arylsulfatase A-like enzyme